MRPCRRACRIRSPGACSSPSWRCRRRRRISRRARCARSRSPRSSGCRTIPTFRRSATAFPGVEVIGWFVIAAPAGTPAEIVTRMNRELDKILKDPEIVQPARDRRLLHRRRRYARGDARLRAVAIRSLGQGRARYRAAAGVSVGVIGRRTVNSDRCAAPRWRSASSWRRRPPRRPALDGASIGWPWALPFVGLLLSIATGPLLFPEIWHGHYGKIAFMWSALTLAPLAALHGIPVAVAGLVHAMLAEYLELHRAPVRALRGGGRHPGHRQPARNAVGQRG